MVTDSDSLGLSSIVALLQAGVPIVPDNRAALMHDKFVVIDGAVVRMPKAYPVYGRGYQDGLATVREFVATVPNLQLVGRNGMHRYNNQDHSMLTAILAARNVAGAQFDLWNLSVDRDYLEAGPQISNEEIAALERTQPLVPTAI